MEARGEEARRAILACLRSPELSLRTSTLDMVEELPLAISTDPEIQGVIFALAEDPDPSVRYWALNAVCELPDEAGTLVAPFVKQHLELYLGGSDYFLRSKVLAMLRTPGDYEPVPWILRLLEDEDLRAQAIDTLADIGDPNALLVVRRYADDPDTKVQQAVKDYLKAISESVEKRN